MAVIFFLALVVLVAVVWTLVALAKGSKEVVNDDADPVAGHEFPAEREEAPTLLEDDLSFSNRETAPTDDGRARTPG
jgi:hypothetical protein